MIIDSSCQVDQVMEKTNAELEGYKDDKVYLLNHRGTRSVPEMLAVPTLV